MSLQKELDAFKEKFQRQAPEKALRIMSKATDSLSRTGVLDSAIKKGDRMPPFSLPNQDGDRVQLTELLANGPLLINVFRGVWCPFCSIELKALNAILQELKKRRTTLVGLAPQLQKSAKENKSKLSLEFDILVDQGNQYANKLGLCYDLPGDLIDVYKEFGIDIPMHNGDETWRLPMPARLLVDQEGIVIYADVNPDYTVRPEPEAVLEVLDKQS